MLPRTTGLLALAVAASQLAGCQTFPKPLPAGGVDMTQQAIDEGHLFGLPEASETAAWTLDPKGPFFFVQGTGSATPCAERRDRPEQAHCKGRSPGDEGASEANN